MFILLLVIFRLAGRTRSDGPDLTVDLLCPEGWLTREVFFHTKQQSNEKVSTCEICEWNSILPHPFKFVEICVVHNPQTPDTLKVEIQETIKKPNHPLCGVNLTINNKDAIFQNYLPCEERDYFYTYSKHTVDLLCPNLFKFHSAQSRNVTWKKGSTLYTESTKCLICKSNNLVYADETHISICPFDEYIWPQRTIQNITIYDPDQCQTGEASGCEQNKLSHVNPDQHCGSRFSLSSQEKKTIKASNDNKTINVSNYIHCCETEMWALKNKVNCFGLRIFYLNFT